jgi:hypothetical protein
MQPASGEVEIYPDSGGSSSSMNPSANSPSMQTPASAEVNGASQVILNAQRLFAYPPSMYPMGAPLYAPHDSQGYMDAMRASGYVMDGGMNYRDPAKRKRTNYRDPENAAKLTTALGMLIQNQQDGRPLEIKSVAKLFAVPYNTLRDNFLK